MSRKKVSKSTFLQFFKEEAAEIISPDVSEQTEQVHTEKIAIPSIKTSTQAEETEVREWWKKLRKFYVTSQSEDDEKGIANLIPLHLSTFQHESDYPDKYPVWLKDQLSESLSDVSNLCTPLADLLTKCINKISDDENNSKIIRSNVLHILHKALVAFGNSDKPVLFSGAIAEALDEVAKNLNVKGSEGVSFEVDIAKLKLELPESGALIPWSPLAPFYILSASLTTVGYVNKKRLKKQITGVLPELKNLLAVEAENYPEEDTDHLKSALGTAGSFMNPDELSSVLPKSASEHMQPQRINRIKKAVRSLENASIILNKHAVILIQDGLFDKKTAEWKNIFEGSEIIGTSGKTMCASSLKYFEKYVKEFEEIIIALRIGQLEAGNKYDNDLHGDYFSAFTWKMFANEEMLAFPPVVLIADVNRILNNELQDFAQLLTSGYPVKLLLVQQYGLNHAENNANVDRITRQEPAAMAVSYRNTFVMQSTSLSPETLYRGFSDGVSSFAPGLFYVLTGNTTDISRSLLWSSAAIEGRDFPGFVYNGKQGTEWGSRFEIADNPQEENDWPQYSIQIKNGDDKQESWHVPFTYADFAAWVPGNENEFMRIPPQYWTEYLIPISDYILMPDEDKYIRIPYIWMMDNEYELHKVAVSWHIFMACVERLDFWHYIQDCSGINSFHVNHALEEERKKIRAETLLEIQKLKEEHRKELDIVRKETASEAMERLTSVLLDIDTDSILPSTKPTPTEKDISAEGVEATSEQAVATPQEKPGKEQEDEDEELLTGEPWIETPLCTSCNDCPDINNRMFKYNTDKMAFIADPKAGTFAELVEAAQICPVKIIHPGKPLNPDEPDLEELIKIAEKFN